MGYKRRHGCLTQAQAIDVRWGLFPWVPSVWEIVESSARIGDGPLHVAE